MALQPLFLDLKGWPVTVVGGGSEAAARVAELRGAGAEVTVISPELCDDLASLARDGGIRWFDRRYADGDLAGARLVFAATHSPSDLDVAGEAGRRHVPIHLLDDPGRSTCLDPAWFRHGPVTVAVSAGGAAPDLDHRLRSKLQQELPPLYGRVAEIVARYREKAARAISSRSERRAFLQDLIAFLDGPEVHEELAAGHLDGALAGARTLLEKHVRRAG